jgi:cysteine dioxygenase
MVGLLDKNAMPDAGGSSIQKPTSTLERKVLDRIEGANATSVLLAELFRELRGLRPQDFFECALFSEEKPYGRKLLYRSPHLEILIMGFLPGRECPPHDHGRAEGLVFVCFGEVVHRIFRRVLCGLKLANETRESTGSTFAAPVNCVHSMGNASRTEPLITLHAYWPPIDNMSIFDLQSGCVHTVNDEAGAWLPVDPPSLLRTRPLS